MPATVIVGLQWGDEGKGKATDFLAEQVRWVVRYQGGDNAGHTIVLGKEVFKLHLVPSGVLYPHIVPLIGPGVVVNPATLIRELDGLAARGDRRLAGARLARRPRDPARTTSPRTGRRRRAWAARGSGRRTAGSGPPTPTAPPGSASGWRTSWTPRRSATSWSASVPDANARLAHLGDPGEPFLVEAILEAALGWGERLRPIITDTTTLVQDALRAGDHVLFEGAQGTLLDLDHGSYPFVTSSNPVAGGACTGGGIGPLQVSEVIGVMKAYTTRVGAGPYPTELHDAIGEGIATRGHEFGTTTGRRRRVGWFDAVPLRYAVDVNSVSSIVLNKLDILSGIDDVLLCVAYEIDGAPGRALAGVGRGGGPGDARSTSGSRAGAEEIHEARTPDDLPPNARAYVSALEALAGVPIRLVSVGPERTQTVVLHDRPLGAGRAGAADRRGRRPR